jgi:hypothetical protein
MWEIFLQGHILSTSGDALRRNFNISQDKYNFEEAPLGKVPV